MDFLKHFGNEMLKEGRKNLRAMRRSEDTEKEIGY